jgi:hypothetical protein
MTFLETSLAARVELTTNLAAHFATTPPASFVPSGLRGVSFFAFGSHGASPDCPASFHLRASQEQSKNKTGGNRAATTCCVGLPVFV